MLLAYSLGAKVFVRCDDQTSKKWALYDKRAPKAAQRIEFVAYRMVGADRAGVKAVQ